MPDWVPDVAVATVAIVVMIWLVRRVAPGWLPGADVDPAPRRPVTPRRTIATWVAAVLTVLALVWILSFVFAAK